MTPRLEQPSTRVTLLAALAAVALLVAGFVTCVVGLDHRSDVRAAESDRGAVSAQAGEAVAHVFSVSEGTWQQDRRTARTYLAEPMSTSLAAALAAGPPDGVVSVAWEPLDTATVDLDDDSATALVVARVTVTPRGSAVQTADRTVQASMTRIDDRWLLTGMDEL
ncbi:hypothetical protein L5G32_08140 [Gordonia sp. HY002]|uniref:hypothetical protein n=1 Tax=Gordonia zhenghanii TaxID=2911516 RepID=UPI001EEFCFC3|nr:hypothetical protein [Gordonia zhenghanii]MCF8570235.1 hypothetical protein [Gordonia zhenghanii]MCF8607064.1 hypothetical protein [Gordonia zhenghanii]